MSNAVFPILPGLKLELSKTPTWSTRAKQSLSGREVRASYWSYPTIKYELSYEVLRTYTATSELAEIIGFFNARKGSFDSFLYNDPQDNAVVDQGLGLVQAGVLSYQLVRNQGGHVAPVGCTNGASVIKANDTVVSAATYSINDAATLTFTTLPAVNATLTWTGSYYARVKFSQDAMEFDRFTALLWGAKKIQFQTDKAI